MKLHATKDWTDDSTSVVQRIGVKKYAADTRQNKRNL